MESPSVFLYMLILIVFDYSQRCSGQFQFEKRLKTSYADNENDTGSESGGVYDEGDSREADGESHEEIFSPAS